MIVSISLKVAILVFAVIAKFIFASVEPIIKNYIYMNQMSNTTEGFMNMQLYPMIGYTYYAIVICVLILIVVDVVTIIKLHKGE